MMKSKATRYLTQYYQSTSVILWNIGFALLLKGGACER